MSTQFPRYEIYAIRYATRSARRAEHFVGGDRHDGAMPMDYFTWLIRGDGRAILVDTGFTAQMAQTRERTFLRCPIETLRLFDVEPAHVRDVVLTHLHYDHVGNFHKLPGARFHLQERELAYATGRYMRYPFFAHSFEVDEVVGVVRLNYAGRVQLLAGVVELAPGITLHPAHGHTAGLQVVRVSTARGWVVLASDASHFYENMTSNRPFTVGLNLGEMIDAFRLLEELASSPDHIIPGHDPQVMQRYPSLAGPLSGVAVALHQPPREQGLSGS